MPQTCFGLLDLAHGETLLRRNVGIIRRQPYQVTPAALAARPRVRGERFPAANASYLPAELGGPGADFPARFHFRENATDAAAALEELLDAELPYLGPMPRAPRPRRS